MRYMSTDRQRVHDNYFDSALSLALTNAPVKSCSGGEALRPLREGDGDGGNAPGIWPLNEEGALAVGDGSREETARDGCGEGVRASVGVGTGRVEFGFTGFTGRGGGGDAGRSAWC